MSKRERVEKQKTKREKETENAPALSKTDTKLKDDLDEILDEIDEVLEVNAQEFVEQYVQRGGE